MKLEQAIVYFEMGYDIARVEWEDGDFVRLIFQKQLLHWSK